MDHIPVLLDTDIGSDIDDAMALAYLLKQPRCELLGITTVSGNVQERAALAEVLCRAAGKPEVPIHCGRRSVLTHGVGQPRVPQYEAVANQAHRLDRPENTAVEFLRETIRSRPKEITLLSIGPFSNIALLFAIDPEIPFLVKSVVSMAGVFFAGDRREWNALVDPTATSMVYCSPKEDHLSVGLDVTERCRLSASEVRRRFVGEPLSTVTTFAESWFRQANDATFHDPLAAALIFKPELCEYESGQVVSSITPDLDHCGHTRLEIGPGPDRVAKTVDALAFFEEFFAVTTE
ncbi:MAG: nucleoside hydrolase [Fimbriimonas sp.]|nr:nucleoside hydrolase [Fimbriimonas sp.]